MPFSVVFLDKRQDGGFIFVMTPFSWERIVFGVHCIAISGASYLYLHIFIDTNPWPSFVIGRQLHSGLMWYFAVYSVASLLLCK